MSEGNGWEEERKLVRFRLDSITDELKEMRQESTKNFQDLNGRIGNLEIRAALYGGLGGSGLAGLIHFLTKVGTR